MIAFALAIVTATAAPLGLPRELTWRHDAKAHVLRDKLYPIGF